MRRQAFRFVPAALVLLVACGGSESFTPTEAIVAGSEDLGGMWTLAGDRVTFDQSADTFVGEVEFIAGRNTLTGEGTFGGASVFLQLVKGD